MNKKLRLLVTAECPNKCPMCCNNRFDLKQLPVVESLAGYEEIMITGGEPLLFPKDIQTLCIFLKNRSNAKIYIYTANFDIEAFDITSVMVDGYVYTPHSKKDVDEFLKLNDYLLEGHGPISPLSLRLNIFPEVETFIPKNTDLYFWKVKKMHWIKDCPVPEGEDFYRINPLLSHEKE